MSDEQRRQDLADFLRTRRAWSLRVCLLATVLVPTIHPQGLPLATAILGWLVDRGHRFQHLGSEQPSLETVFLNLTGRSLRD